MKAFEHERRDWVIIVLILLFGLFCILLAGRWALRFTPLWKLDANMESMLDPNRDFLTRRPSGFIEPVDPAILTNPAWINVFLTPGASFATGTSFPLTTGTSFLTPITTGTLATTQTPTSIASPTNTVAVKPTPTNAIIFFPPPSTSTPGPEPADTSTATSTSTSASISTTTPTSGPTSTSTSTSSIVVSTSTPTSTSTFIATATSTPTSTSTVATTSTSTATSTSAATPTSGVSCTTTITITGTSGSYVKPSGATCFQYTDLTFVNGGIFQLTSTGVVGMVSGSGCPGKSIADGSTIDYGVEQSGGLMTFRITGLAGTVDINISDWTTYPTCP